MFLRPLQVVKSPAVEQAHLYVVSQTTSKTERNRCRVVLLIFEERGSLVPGCFGVAKLDVNRIVVLTRGGIREERDRGRGTMWTAVPQRQDGEYRETKGRGATAVVVSLI